MGGKVESKSNELLQYTDVVLIRSALLPGIGKVGIVQKSSGCDSSCWCRLASCAGGYCGINRKFRGVPTCYFFALKRALSDCALHSHPNAMDGTGCFGGRRTDV